MLLYSDLQREYRMLDYSPSHSQVLIRAMKSINFKYNIDILIKGAVYINLPVYFEGFNVSLDDQNEKDTITELNINISTLHHRFNIETNFNSGYFIYGTAIGIYKSNQDILESSIGMFDYHGPDELILWYPENKVK